MRSENATIRNYIHGMKCTNDTIVGVYGRSKSTVPLLMYDNGKLLICIINKSGDIYSSQQYRYLCPLPELKSPFCTSQTSAAPILIQSQSKRDYILREIEHEDVDQVTGHCTLYRGNQEYGFNTTSSTRHFTFINTVV